MAMHVPTLEAGGMEEEAHTTVQCTLTGGVTTDHYLLAPTDHGERSDRLSRVRRVVLVHITRIV